MQVNMIVLYIHVDVIVSHVAWLHILVFWLLSTSIAYTMLGILLFLGDPEIIWFVQWLERFFLRWHISAITCQIFMLNCQIFMLTCHLFICSKLNLKNVFLRKRITASCCCVIPQNGKIKVVSSSNEMLITSTLCYLMQRDKKNSIYLGWFYRHVQDLF